MLKYLNYDIVFQEIPDEITLAINVTNCPYHCDGCHSPELREDVGIKLSFLELNRLIDNNKGITCVCMMGGDRFEVENLSDFVRKTKNLKYAWYTALESLALITMSNFDYVKLGRYIKELGGLKNPNTNQRLYKIEDDQTTDLTSLIQNK